MKLDRAVPAALAVLIRGGKVLLVRRRNPPDAGLWGYPGGRIEPGETAFQAAIRELAEETGILAKPLEQIDSLEILVRDAAGAVAFHYRMAAIRCQYISGRAVASDDATEAAWVDPQMVLEQQLPLSRDVDDVLRKGLLRT